MVLLVVQLVLPRCQIFRVGHRIAKLVQLLRWDVQLRRHQFGLRKVTHGPRMNITAILAVQIDQDFLLATIFGQ